MTSNISIVCRNCASSPGFSVPNINSIVAATLAAPHQPRNVELRGSTLVKTKRSPDGHRIPDSAQAAEADWNVHNVD